MPPSFLTPLRDFDPFQNRLCRDVRNGLSESVPASVHAASLAPSQGVADAFLAEVTTPAVRIYIADRLSRYALVLAAMESAGVDATERYTIAAMLWDQALFFEVHEVLEEKWHRSQGDERKMIQALIRAAGVYVHLEYGRRESAEKMAKKAVQGLMAHGESVASPFDAEVLARSLNDLTTPPPRLMRE